MENKNTIIALVLMGVVWMGFSLLFPNSNQNSAPPASESQSAAVQPVAKEESKPAPSEPTPSTVPVVATDQTGAQDLTIETDLFRMVLTTSGARVKSLALKKYQVSDDPDSDLVTLIDVKQNSQATLVTSGTDGWGIPADAVYNTAAGDRQVSGEETLELSFVWTGSDGLQVEKIFSFQGNRYDFDLKVRIYNQTDVSRQGNLNLALYQPWDDQQKISSFDFIGPMTLVGEDLKTDKVKDLVKESKTYQAPVWSGFETKYFMSVLVPQNQAADKVLVRKTAELVENRFESPYSTLPPGGSAEFSFVGFFGPRDLDIVKQVNHRLNEAIDFGFFSPLALPLRLVLNFFYGFVGNYGVAIILLTVIIKLLFWPLTQKSYSSMREMQKLQPEMQRIREKYKKDKERLNQEIMQLYKAKRVNPLGGCLPMLVQIPVFFALYRVLMVDIGLRHAPFFFWLTDLSAKDPYYITPVIMGVTMFIQQKMTPTSADPTQAKVFMLMPVIFTFMFLNFPSGLVIYWLVNNLLTILQQYLIRREKTA